MEKRPLIAIIGAGPAGLMAAETAAQAGARVEVFDQMPSPARKFLMAGKSGLNITHAEDYAAFVERYTEGGEALRAHLGAFGPERLRGWMASLGVEETVGSTGRVFPVQMKASPLLRAWLARLDFLGVRLHRRHKWVGFTPKGRLQFETETSAKASEPAATVLAMGGGSWARLGSDGAWADVLRQEGVEVAPFLPSNAGVVIPWSEFLIEKFSGAPLKAVRLSVGDAVSRGEVVITPRGIEGGGVYTLSAAIRAALAEGKGARLHIDLAPDLSHDALVKRLSRPRGRDSRANFLRKAVKLDPLKRALLREAGEVPDDPAALAAAIKKVALPIAGFTPLDEAISTAGGLPLSAVDEQLMLRARPGVFACGEMLDWDAPTGGYLMTACFATGAAAGRAAAAYALKNGG